jgi:hypothetical protein
VLRLPRALSESAAFEYALRERAMRFGSFRQASCVRSYRVERVEPPTGGLALVSQHVEGVRLSDLLHVAHDRAVTVDLSTSLSVIRQLLPAITLLHDHAKNVACGLIAPERIIVTPRGRIAVAEQALGGAIEQLRYGPDRLWSEFRIAAGAESERVSFSQRTDVMSIGVVALALMLGRPLRQDEFPTRIPQLLDAARERSDAGHERPLSEPLRDWLVRALQLAPSASFASAAEAWLALERMAAADPLYFSIPIALEIFVYSCTSARMSPPAADTPAAAPPSISIARTAGNASGEAAWRQADVTGPARAGRSDELPEQHAVPIAACSDTAPAPLDWTDARRPVAETSFDIAQLFSDTDLQPSAAGDVEPRLAAPSLVQPGARDTASEALPADQDPMPEAVLQAMDDTPAEPWWKAAMPLHPRSLLRRLVAGGRSQPPSGRRPRRRRGAGSRSRLRLP